jgi:predicted DNA binding CopG/RHH family protein
MDREQTTIRLPKDVMETVRKLASEQGQSINTILTMLIQKALGLG